MREMLAWLSNIVHGPIRPMYDVGPVVPCTMRRGRVRLGPSSRRGSVQKPKNGFCISREYCSHSTLDATNLLSDSCAGDIRRSRILLGQHDNTDSVLASSSVNIVFSDEQVIPYAIQKKVFLLWGLLGSTTAYYHHMVLRVHIVFGVHIFRKPVA